MFLGLDLGTTNIKALVVDAHGRVVDDGSAAVDRVHTPDHGVEQNIEDIWDQTCAAVRQAVMQLHRGALDSSEIRAVGISSQGAALQLLDADGKPIGPVISWLDARGRPFDDRITGELGEDFLAEHIGRYRSTMAGGQILRLRQQVPDLLEMPNQIGFVGDVIVGRLCGRRAHDATSLSIAALLNPSLGRADPEWLRYLGIREEQLPELLPVTTPAGPLGAKPARQMGLPEGIPVSAAVHDQYAAAIGSGSVGEGDICLGTGTAWVLVANAGKLGRPITPETFVCPHPIE
jgi:sugar (pentulose or hexulose) kinase